MASGLVWREEPMNAKGNKAMGIISHWAPEGRST